MISEADVRTVFESADPHSLELDRLASDAPTGGAHLLTCSG
jgi:hypothetical protein